MSCNSYMMKLKNTPKSYWASGKQYSTENYHSDVGDGEKCYANNNSSGGGIPWDNEKRQAFILMLTLGGNTTQNVAECFQRNVEKYYTWDQLNLLTQDFYTYLYNKCDINPNMDVRGDLGTPARSPQSPTTPPPPPPDKGLPVGAIIGIIIGALIVLALILLLMHKKVSV